MSGIKSPKTRAAEKWPKLIARSNQTPGSYAKLVSSDEAEQTGDNREIDPYRLVSSAPLNVVRDDMGELT